MVVSVVDSVEELSGLWQEGSDLAITPTRQNALAVSHELNGVAFKAKSSEYPDGNVTSLMRS